jgi:hypothetical protein
LKLAAEAAVLGRVAEPEEARRGRLLPAVGRRELVTGSILMADGGETLV